MAEEVLWKIAPHTSAKHDLLRAYLQAWSAIFGQTAMHSTVNFIDGFAGPGIYEDGEPGSPIVALKAVLEHSAFKNFSGTKFNFLFNEQHAGRFESLRTQVDLLAADMGGLPPNVKVDVEQRNFHELGEELLASMKAGEGLAPTFFFIDPFGYKDVPIDLMRRLLDYRACEMLIYFDFNSVNRFATAGNVDPHFEALFGTDEFKNAPASGKERHEYLIELYERQLKTIGNFAYVRRFAMVPEHGHVGYYLIFCTRDLQAFDKMKAQMWKIDPSGEYRFEDRLAGQPVLVGLHGSSTDALMAEISKQFAGQEVSIEEIVDWVKADTPFYSGQVKVKTLRPMQKQGLLRGVQQKTAGLFPPGTTMQFP